MSKTMAKPAANRLPEFAGELVTVAGVVCGVCARVHTLDLRRWSDVGPSTNSLHTSAKEQGWQRGSSGWRCPTCAGARAGEFRRAA